MSNVQSPDQVIEPQRSQRTQSFLFFLLTAKSEGLKAQCKVDFQAVIYIIETMRGLKFFVLLMILLTLSLYPFSLTFKQVGEYEENAVYTDVKVLGSYAFLVAGNRGVHIFDVSNSYSPKKISVIESMDRSYAIDIKGFNLYIADGMAGVRIFDIRNKSKPEQLSFIPTSEKSLDLVVSGDYCFVADGYGGFRIFDISKPFFPREISNWDESDYVNSIEVIHDYAFFGDEKGILSLLTSVEFDSLNQYKRISEFGPVNKIVSDGRFLFAASNERGLLVADISDVSNPLLQELPGKYSRIDNMFLSGFYLYAIQNGQLGVLNMLVPFNPYSSGNLSINTEVVSVFVSGNLVYAACGVDGFKIFKISD